MRATGLKGGGNVLELFFILMEADMMGIGITI